MTIQLKTVLYILSSSKYIDRTWCTLSSPPPPPHPKSEVSTTTKLLCTGGYSTVRQLLTMTTCRDWNRCALPSSHIYFILGFFFFFGKRVELIRFTVPHHTRPESRLLFNKTSQNQVVTFQEMEGRRGRFTICVLRESICDPATACQRQNEVCVFSPRVWLWLYWW